MIFQNSKLYNWKFFTKLTSSLLLVLLFYSYMTYVNAGWKKVIESSNGQTFYVSMDSILEKSGHVFFWELIDYNKKDEYGDLSAKIYIKGDCKNLRFKWLKLSYHKFPMARDESEKQSPSKIVADWQYPRSNSTSMQVLHFVCNNKGIVL